MSTGYAMCGIGTYCRVGSSEPTNCPSGYFCDYQTTEPSTCPAGWYCLEYTYPMVEYPPLLCQEGTICPISSPLVVNSSYSYVYDEGCVVPIVCSAGNYAIMTRDAYSGTVPVCGYCAPGTYSLASSTGCKICNAGYICLGNSTVASPTNRQIYKGYQCGKGYYCPSGGVTPIPCPLGTYTVNETLQSLDECTKCPNNTYSDSVAAVSCSNCTSSSYSYIGSTTCTCIGNYRIYLKKKQSCVCITGYQYIDSNGKDLSSSDGTGSCAKIVYPRCATGQVLDEQGNCRSPNDCSTACGGAGTRPSSIGACLCQNIQDLNGACNEECRNTAISYSIGTDGSIIETNGATGSTSSINQTNIGSLYGNLTCSTASNCNLYVLEYGSNYSSNYGKSTLLSSKKNRELTTTIPTTSIINPVVCLKLGESMLFTVTPPDHYPVYLQKSLLNSNTNFDYSQFVVLGENIAAGDNIQAFAFTFTTPGVYVFSDHTDTEQEIIVGVMNTSQQCPFNGANVQPRSASALYLLGTKLDSNLTLSVDWYVVYSTMGILVLAIIIFSGIFYYYTLLVWNAPPMKRVIYREENFKMNLKGDEGTRTTMKIVIEGKEASSSGSEAEEIKDMMFEKVPDSAANDIHVDDDKQHIDTALLQAIKDKIRENNAMFLNFLEDNENDALDRMKRLEEETTELRNLLRSLLDPIAMAGRGPSKQFSKDFGSTLSDGFRNQTQPSNERDYQEAVNEIVDNSGLIEQDKQKLMNELNSELNKLNQNLSLEKSKHDEELNRRLAARAQKRRDLERQKEEIVAEEKQMLKRHQNEIWQISVVIETDEQKLSQEITEDRFEMSRKLLGQQAVDLQNRLREGLSINPDKQQDLMRQYEQELQGLEKNLSMNQIKQQQDLARRIEEKKRQRKAAMKDKEAKMNAELEMKQILELEEIRKRKMEIEAQEIVASVMPIIAEVHQEDELKQLESKQKEEILGAEKELKEVEEQITSKLLRNSSLIDTKLANQRAELENQKKQLLESVHTATEEEREELIRDLAKTDARLKEITEQQSIENKKNIDARLDIRRQKREEKLKELKDKQEKERLQVENVIKAKEKNDKAANLEQAIKEVLAKLPEDQKDKAIQAMLEEKHENERMELQRKLKNKLRDCQRNAIQDVMRMKANDLELLRNEYREKFKLPGRDADTATKIQKEEAEALNKLDYYYMKKLEGLQEDAWRNQQKKNQEELLELIDSQLAEMRKHMRKQDPNKQESEEKLKKEREGIEAEGKEKIEMLEKQKKELELLKISKQKELEEMIMKEKQREEKERQMKEVLDKKRALMERQKKEREDLLKRGQLTKEQMEKLIADHQRELNALETAIARERERQIAIMSQKIAEKKGKKKEYENSMLKIKEEQERWQKELEELPGISNKQATTLLLKWRRHPKKGLKDIEKSIKTNDPAQKILPIVNKQEIIPTQTIKDSRLEELMLRIQNIESTVNHVDSEQLNSIMKSINGIEQKLKKFDKK